MSENTQERRGAPANNDNAVTHGLYQDRNKLFNRLDEDEKRLVVEIATDLLDKFDGDVGAYEREAIRNIALDTLKRIQANEHILAEELVKDGSERADRINMAYSRIMRDTTKEMKELGLLSEGPAMKSAEAQAGWMDQISDAKDDE
jgi:hypothetical protein